MGAAAAMPGRADELVVNGGFETGDFTGWIVNPNSSIIPWSINSASSGPGQLHGPNSGTYFVSTGCTGPSCLGSDTLTTTNYLYQDLSTVAGDTYQVSFYFASGGAPSELLVTFGGTTIADLVDLPGSIFSSYTEYTEDIVATGTTSRLEFDGRQDPAYDALDDISVIDLSTAGPTPEPASLWTGGLGLALFAFNFRRNRKH